MHGLSYVLLLCVVGTLLYGAAPTSAAAATAGIAPMQLSCDARENPLGIDSATPRLGWKLKSADAAARGLTQSAYQILVASSPESLAKDAGDVWDSGKVESDASAHVAYAGPALKSDQHVWWKVRVWDGAGAASAWSEPAQWGMGVLRAEDWQAQWVAAPPEMTTSANDTSLLRSEFTVKPGLRRATVNVCGLGQYEMRVNGAHVTADVLAPGWTAYDKTCLYDTYDVTPLVREGANGVGLLLGNGMYRVAKGGRYAKFERTYGPLQAIARLRLEYADGSSEIVGTGENWRAGPSPMTFSSIYGGEDWDARLEQDGWDRARFGGGEKWRAVTLTQGPGGALRGTNRSAAPVRTFKTHAGRGKVEVKPNVTIYDLGQVASHLVRVTVRGPAGSAVKITPTELLNADGTIFRNNYNGKSSVQYTLAGRGGGDSETYTTKFFYSGLRYLQVECVAASGADEVPKVESIKGVVAHSSVTQIGEFSCSNELFNRVYGLVRWAELGNMMSVISDCPHRERLGWLEQSHLHGPSFWYGFDMRPLFTKIIGDMADCQEASGLVPTCVPDYPKFPPKWRDAIEWGSGSVMIPWQQYLFTGDLGVLRNNYPMMKRYVAYISSKSKDDIAPPGLGDWSGRGPSPETQKELITTALYYEDATVLARAARLLGEEADAAAHEQLAASIRKAFNATFFNADTGQYGKGSQAAHALALSIGLVEPAHREAVLANLIKDIESRKYAMTVGEVGLPYLLRALADGGRSDVNFAMHNQSEHPGYGYQIAHGATALCETWDAWRDNSQIQFMLGHIVEWFYRDLGGIRPDADAPGFKRFVIRPSVVGDLTEVKCAYDSVRGRIVSEWRRDGNRLSLHVIVPPNTTATVYVPADAPDAVTEAGRAVDGAGGAKFNRMDGGYAAFGVGSGEYTFASTLPKR